MKERHKNVASLSNIFSVTKMPLLQPQELNTNVKLCFIIAYQTEGGVIYLNAFLSRFFSCLEKNRVFYWINVMACMMITLCN